MLVNNIPISGDTEEFIDTQVLRSVRQSCYDIIQIQGQMITSFFVNAAYLVFVYRMEYASDLGWSRVRFVSFIIIVVQFLLGVWTTYNLVQILLKILYQNENEIDCPTVLAVKSLENEKNCALQAKEALKDTAARLL